MLNGKAVWYSFLFVFSEVVKDYILKAKAHMSKTCQDMEAGLSLASHYVDVQVSQRDVFSRCGKNTNRFLDKELIIMGDTDRQKSLLGQSQVKLLMDRKIILINNCLVPFEHCNSVYMTSEITGSVIHWYLYVYLSPLRSSKAQMETKPNATYCYLAMLVWEKPP